MAYPFDCITDFIFVETPLEPADVILVPGGSIPQLMERAAELYHQGLAPYILPSGGKNSKLDTTEWEFLRSIGLKLGVPENAILKEDRASNTFENARFSWLELQSRGIEVKKAILVCKSFHARRALLTYQVEFPRDVEFFVNPVPDRNGTTRDNWFVSERRIELVMTEVTKIGQYFQKHIPNWL